MDVMTAYVQSLNDEALADLAAKNLVTSQARIVKSEMDRRSVTKMRATNPDELRARMAAAGSGFGVTCPDCGGDVAPIMLANWGCCLKCKVH